MRISLTACLAWALCLIIALCTNTPAVAQFITGTVTGRVLDPSSNVIVGAPITLVSATTKEARKTTTNETGAFTFAAVQPGVYSLTVEQSGFQTYHRAGFVVSSNERAALGDITLKIGTVSDAVTVTAEGALVQTASSETSALVSAKQLELLLVRSRDVVSLLRLAPGVVSTYDSEVIGGGGYGSTTPYVQGTRRSWNVFAVDGLSGSDHGDATTFSSNVNMDAVSEVKILSNNYQAEYGRSGGALVDIVTKSGGQQFHGSGYWYKRHEMFNANDFFNNKNKVSKALYRYLTLGATIGGPVYIPKVFNTDKSKLFFFYSLEHWETKTPKSMQRFTVPTALERVGDFSQSVDVNNKLIVVNDPITKQPLPGNQMPTSSVNRNGQALLNIFHNPNALDRGVTLGNYNYVMQESLETPKRQHLFKIDYLPTAKDRLSVRGSTWWSDQRGYATATPSSSWDLVQTKYTYTDNGMVAAYSHIFAPWLVNEFSAGLRHGMEKSPVLSQEELNHVVRSKVNMTLGQFTSGINPLNIIPSASFGGITGAGSYSIHNRFDQAGVDTAFNANDTISITRGTHLIKLGILAEILRNDEAAAGTFNGSFSFSRSVNNPFDTNHPYANALFGEFYSYTESTTRPPFQGYKKVWEWFAQDSWKVTPRLTIEYGMRFSWYTHWSQRKGQVEANKGAAFSLERYSAAAAPSLYMPGKDANGVRVGVDPATKQTVPSVLIGAFVPGSGDFVNGMVLSSDRSYPKGWMEQEPVQLSPRLGFAYDVFGRGKTAVRGSVGVFPVTRPGNWYSIILQPPTQYNPVMYYGNLNTFLSSEGSLFPSSVMGYQKKSKTPALYKFSFGVQQEIGFGTVADVSYVGSLGRHLIQSRNINTIPYGARFLPQNADPANPSVALADNFLRPYQGHASITVRENTGTSNYNALQVAVNRRYTKGLQMGVAYTWSKSMDYDSSDGGGLPMYRPLRVWSYGRSTFDQTHNIVFSYTWDLPKASKLWANVLVRKAFDNWQLAGLTVFGSGQPSGVGFSTTDSVDLTGGGDGQRIVVTGKAQLSHGDRTATRWFDTSVFARPQKGDYGNAPKDVFRGPGINNWDISAVKNFPIRSEARYFQLRWEMYNAFNHTQFAGVNATATFDAQGRQVNSQFGQVTSARSPRVMQASLRLTF